MSQRYMSLLVEVQARSAHRGCARMRPKGLYIFSLALRIVQYSVCRVRPTKEAKRQCQ